jgi:YidC/Oxa1 family membrane protein insertase
MDRNSIIGFVLLLLLGTGYIFWNNHEQQQYLAQKAIDSVAQAAVQKPVTAQQPVVPSTDSAKALPVDSTLPATFRGTASYVSLDNGDLKLRFSTKGGYPVQATLNHYKTFSGDTLSFFNGKDNKLSFTIPVNGKTITTDELYFTPELKDIPANGGHQLSMTAELSPGKKIVLNYVLPAKGFMLSASFRLIGFQQDLAGVKAIPLTWNTYVLHTEKDLKLERSGRYSSLQVHFRYNDGEHDYFTVSRTPEKELEKPLQWFCIRSSFFNSTIIADKSFSTAAYHATEPKEDTEVVATNSCAFTLPVVDATNNYSFGFRWFIGPDDYNLLKSYNLGMEEVIPLGFGVFFFVKYISKWVIIPLFNFLGHYVSSMWLVIILMTLIIRLCLSFFTYKSQLSAAKMRVLKPELDELKKRLGGDQKQIGMEQMKLYRTAGVNPLGGCIPMLFQMPFLLAIYYFLPTAIELRQQPFLWANDLSTYDSIFNLGFNIPFYGDHVSLFTLLMTATSLVLAIYNKNMTPSGGAGEGQMANMMKYMPYVMPFMFLGWFNTYAAGLTLYYTVSNLFSIGQQFVIQKFIIDESAIHAKMQEKKNKPATTSKWQEKLEQIQKAQAEKMKQKK